MLPPLLFNVFLAAGLDGGLSIVRFSHDEGIVSNLVQLSDTGERGTGEQELLACVRRVVWGILYADDAEIV